MAPRAATDLKLTVRDIAARQVVVPLARPLVTSIVTIESAALLLIDLRTEEGVTGHACVFGYGERANAHLAGLLGDIAAMTAGRRVAPVELYPRIAKGLTMMGHQGLATIAASGFDRACWDALARAAGVPLVTLLGGAATPIRAYNSNGLGLIAPGAAADEAPRAAADEAPKAEAEGEKAEAKASAGEAPGGEEQSGE